MNMSALSPQFGFVSTVQGSSPNGIPAALVTIAFNNKEANGPYAPLLQTHRRTPNLPQVSLDISGESGHIQVKRTNPDGDGDISEALAPSHIETVKGLLRTLVGKTGSPLAEKAIQRYLA